MDFFKTLNSIEDGIRRAKLEKSGTEKMGAPHIMGGGERSEVLSDSAKERECAETEESESSEKCEKNSELLSALNFFGALCGQKVTKTTVEKMDPDLRARMEAQHPEMRGGKKKPKSGRGAEWQAAGAKASEEKAPKSSGKKPAKKSGKKATPKKESAKKKDTKKKPTDSGGKSASGPGSGQAGRTGQRKRRSVGEFWWAKSGNRPGMDLWTKREGGQIVRANNEEKKKYNAERKKRGLKGKVEIETGPEDEHKKRSALVKKIKEAKGLTKHMTKESQKEILETLLRNGVITEKQKKTLGKLITEHLGSFKLSLGKPSRWARTPDQVKRDFLDGMDRAKYKDLKEFNKVKERIEKMSVKDFDAMMRSIEFDEDEDTLRDQYGIQGTWKGAPKVGKSFDEALEDIIKTLF
jgi:hypothetical protein